MQQVQTTEPVSTATVERVLPWYERVLLGLKQAYPDGFRYGLEVDRGRRPIRLNNRRKIPAGKISKIQDHLGVGGQLYDLLDAIAGESLWMNENTYRKIRGAAVRILSPRS